MRATLVSILLWVMVSGLVYSQECIPHSKLRESHFFIENKGQWPNEVLFLAKLNGQDTWITREGFVCNAYYLTPICGSEEELGSQKSAQEFLCQGQVINYIFEGRNPLAKASGNLRQPGVMNFFIGNIPDKWVTNVPLFEEVIVHDMYPGIDVRYYFEGHNIRYDLIIFPGAEAEQIKIQTKGIDDIPLVKEGALRFETHAGDIIHNNLVAFQNNGVSRHQVKCEFSVTQNSFGFRLGSYREDIALVIDPMIWSTFIGGTRRDEGYAVIADKFGQIYVTGTVHSANFPTTAGAYSDTLNGNSDVFISKLDSTGSNLAFSTFLGGTDNDDGLAIALGEGSVYVTGLTFSSDFPVTSGSLDETANFGGDAFVTRLDTSGAVIHYSTYFGGNGHDQCNSIAVDQLHNVYLSGETHSPIFPTTPGAFQENFQSLSDGFVAKIDSSGSSLVFSTILGGGGSDDISCMKIIEDGSVYLAGTTNSTSSFPITPGAYNVSSNGGSDGFISRLSPDGASLLSSTFLGGNQTDMISALDIDPQKNIYVAGYTNSTNFPISPGAADSTFGAPGDGFITKLNPSGSTLIFSTFLGGSATDRPYSLVLDRDEGLYVSGGTNSNDFPVTPDAFSSSLAGGDFDDDLFLTRLNRNGTTIEYSTYLGGSGWEESFSMVVDFAGNVYLSGYTRSPDFPVTTSSFDEAHNGDHDVYVTKFCLENAGCIPTKALAQTLQGLIKVYPNPSRDFLVIEFGQLIGKKHLSLSGLSGNLIQRNETELSSFQMDTSSVPRGVYFLMIETAHGRLNKKIIVE